MTGRLTGLDALRGIAAAMVVLYHTTDRAIDNPFPGYLAVDFFFMLSGYVMARTYEARFGNGLPARRFLALRFARLAPLLAVGTLIGFAVALARGADHPAPLLGLVMGLLLLPTPFSGHLYPFNGPTWSIVFELFANAIHALRLRRVATLALVAFGLAMVGLTVVLSVPLGRFSGGTHWVPFLIGFARVLGPYALGIALFRLLRDRALLEPSPWLLFIGLPLALVAGGTLPPLVLGPLFVIAVCPALLVIGLATPHRAGAMLGAWSFPVYALHGPLMAATRLVTSEVVAGLAVAFIGPALLTLALAKWQRVTLRSRFAILAVRPSYTPKG